MAFEVKPPSPHRGSKAAGACAGRTANPALTEGAMADDLVRANLAFVVKVAREYRDLGLPLEDLISEGNVGLIEASRRFDARRGTRFITYAQWWIRKAILRALEQQVRVVHVPGYQIRKARERRATERVLAGKLGRRPTREEVAAHLPGRASAPGRADALSHRETSLDEKVRRDGGETLADMLPDPAGPSPEQIVIRDQSILLVFDAIETLTEQQRWILARRFGLLGEPALSLSELGELLGLSHERVRQIEGAAIETMRRAFFPRARSGRRKRPTAR